MAGAVKFCKEPLDRSIGKSTASVEISTKIGLFLQGWGGTPKWDQYKNILSIYFIPKREVLTYLTCK